MSAAVRPPVAPCPVCRAVIRVRRDGCLREHTRPYEMRWRRRCEGSGTGLPDEARTLPGVA